MGCDIYSYAEVYDGEKWSIVGDVFPLSEFDQKRQRKTHGSHPFDWRWYGMFGFLANVRNYSRVPVLAEPKYSLPEDVSAAIKEEYGDYNGWHTTTWLTLRQLLDFDYDQVFWDRRVMKNGNGAALADEGEGEHLTVRKFLGESFFRDIDVLKTLGDPNKVRVVFWFDN